MPEQLLLPFSKKGVTSGKKCAGLWNVYVNVMPQDASQSTALITASAGRTTLPDAGSQNRVPRWNR